MCGERGYSGYITKGILHYYDTTKKRWASSPVVGMAEKLFYKMEATTQRNIEHYCTRQRKKGLPRKPTPKCEVKKLNSATYKATFLLTKGELRSLRNALEEHDLARAIPNTEGLRSFFEKALSKSDIHFIGDFV